MQKQCPDCKEMFYGDNCTACYKGEPTRPPITCAYVGKLGKSCLLSGTISPHIPTSSKDYPQTYCSFHYQNLHDPEVLNSKTKFSDFIIENVPETIDSSFDWVDYFWTLASGDSPNTAAPYYELKRRPQGIDKAGALILKSISPLLYKNLLSAYPEIKKELEEPAEELPLEKPIW